MSDGKSSTNDASIESTTRRRYLRTLPVLATAGVGTGVSASSVTGASGVPKISPGDSENWYNTQFNLTDTDTSSSLTGGSKADASTYSGRAQAHANTGMYGGGQSVAVVGEKIELDGSSGNDLQVTFSVGWEGQLTPGPSHLFEAWLGFAAGVVNVSEGSVIAGVNASRLKAHHFFVDVTQTQDLSPQSGGSVEKTLTVDSQDLTDGDRYGLVISAGARAESKQIYDGPNRSADAYDSGRGMNLAQIAIEW